MYIYFTKELENCLSLFHCVMEITMDENKNSGKIKEIAQEMLTLFASVLIIFFCSPCLPTCVTTLATVWKHGKYFLFLELHHFQREISSSATKKIK